MCAHFRQTERRPMIPVLILISVIVLVEISHLSNRYHIKYGMILFSKYVSHSRTSTA